MLVSKRVLVERVKDVGDGLTMATRLPFVLSRGMSRVLFWKLDVKLCGCTQ